MMNGGITLDEWQRKQKLCNYVTKLATIVTQWIDYKLNVCLSSGDHRCN
jgi:hypothetical protein